MNIKYITLLTSALLLSACGSDVDTSSQPTSASQQQTTSQIESKLVNNVVDSNAVENDVEQRSTEETEQASQAPEIKFELPLGRLTGIIDAGTYKQAIVDNQGKVIRLKEGGDWQGWTVASIDQNKVTVSQGGEVHSLSLLSEFRSPQLTETELNNQTIAESKNQPVNTEQQADATPPPPQFSEEQLTELRSRLLIGR